MRASSDARARRYLLGEATEEECAAIEEQYFENQDALERVAAAEDELIEDYLSDGLSVADRVRFERGYLSSPQHRVRVDTVRRLMTHASEIASAQPERGSILWWVRMRQHGALLALAASVILVASVTLWRLASSDRPQTEVATDPAASAAHATQTPTAPPPGAPRIFAVVLSPVAVRGGADDRSVAVPPATDVIVLRFETEADGRTLAARRAVIQTVGGDRIWQGPVTAERDPASGSVARIDVPAVRLPADDYLVTLYGTDRAGAEREWAHYFLRLRGQ